MANYFLNTDDTVNFDGNSYIQDNGTATELDTSIALRLPPTIRSVWETLPNNFSNFGSYDSVITSVTQTIDCLPYKYFPLDDSQPLSFPFRNVNSQAPMLYSSQSSYNTQEFNLLKLSTQKKMLDQAVLAQIEYLMNKGSIGQQSYSQKGTSVVDVRLQICLQALQYLRPYMYLQY